MVPVRSAKNLYHVGSALTPESVICKDVFVNGSIVVGNKLGVSQPLMEFVPASI